MAAASKLGRWVSLPPQVLFQKAALSFKRRRLKSSLRSRDKKFPSYSLEAQITGPLRRLFKPVAPELLRPQQEEIRSLAAHFMAHRFDLLGSGWVQVRHGMTCRGLEGNLYSESNPVLDAAGRWPEGEINSLNMDESRRIRNLIPQNNKEYIPIDWAIDFKSGYRWPATIWFHDIEYGREPGVDVKVPWELARMQHLSQFTWAFALSSSGSDGFLAAEVYAAEFRNQVLDFIAANPPRFGVNWVCTMDVAIRVANWLAAYDLFRSYGYGFDPQFENVFVRSVYEHARHIADHLEWNPDYRGNHYLADIAGLLFATVFLPSSKEADQWKNLAAAELIKESELQFNADGSNFEASTCYHRLSAETVLYATAIGTAAGISFPAEHFERLSAMARFTEDITKPDGHVPQIGDNDSGRFLKFFPVYHSMPVKEAKEKYANLKNYAGLPDHELYWMEDHLDHRHLGDALKGFSAESTVSAEENVIHGLAGHQAAAVFRAETRHPENLPSNLEWARWKDHFQSLPVIQQRIVEFPSPGESLLSGLTVTPYPDFGLYIFRSARLYLAVRCGPIGQRGLGGHAHNDQLSVELQIDGRDICRDPGSYVYTPLPEARNRYRSVRAHFAPRLAGREPGNLSRGLFLLGDEAKAECLYFGEKGFIGRHHGFGKPVYRMVELKHDGVRVTDIHETETLDDAARSLELFSPGYGIVISHE